MTDVVHLRPGDYRIMPWKNGGGSTTELWVEPPGVAADAFDWRLSVAVVVRSGPFSVFPGVDRTLTLLSGDGMALEFGRHGEERIDQAWCPVAFSGDWATDCRLLGRPCRDFNVMSRRDRLRHQVTIVRLERLLSLPAAPALAVFALAGAAHVGAVRLGTEETVILRGAERVDAAPAVPGTALLCAAFWPA
jgi:uncharacterized protein